MSDKPKKPEDRKPGRVVRVSRRSFLGTVAVAGGAAVLTGARDALALRNFEGWPNRFGMLTDITRCVGCRSCEAACQKANNLPEPTQAFDDPAVFEAVRRPIFEAYTVVNRYPNPNDPSRPVYRKIQCNHCNEPACATACPVHAYTKTPEGAVTYNADVCFGCRYCMIACPFHVPAYDYHSPFNASISKCILCYGRLIEGGVPACAEVCPTGAVTFGRRSEILRLAREKVASHPERYIQHVYGEREAGGTGWLYISGVPFEQLGFPINLPDKPIIELTRGFLSTVPTASIALPAIFGMCYAALKERDGKGHGSDKDKEEKADG